MDDTHMNDTENTDDVVFEDTIEGEGEAFSKDKIKKLRDEIKTLQAEKADYLASWQKERADFINFKKGEDERKKMTLEYAREGFVEELLPVLDGFDMAFSNKEAWEKLDKGWRTGIEYIRGQFVKILEDNGIAEISPKEGETPDSNLHDFVDTVPTDDSAKDHTIANIMQKGYKIGTRVIRPARVKVYEYKKD